MTSRWVTLIAGFAGLVLVGPGCTARVVDGSAGSTPPAPPYDAGTTAPTPDAGSISPAVVLPPVTCGDPTAPVLDIGPTPLRRLTKADFLNTVTDLLGDVTSLNLDFAAEATTLDFPFRNRATEQVVPPVLAGQYLTAAEKIAADVVKNRLATIMTCNPVTVGEPACARTFINTFGKRAFRRPVQDAQLQSLMAVWQAGRDTGDFNAGIELTITAILQMPEFLYRFELSPAPVGKVIAPLDSWDRATRLSYLLWNSQPDAVLQAAADADQLRIPAAVAAQVTRMLKDVRARGMLARFHDQWLQLDGIPGLEKDPVVFPAFTPTVATAMQDEARRFVEAVIWEGDGKVASLLTSPFSFLNDTLGKFYGVSGTLGPTLTRVEQARLGQRPASGILTLGGILAEHASRNNTSPTHRGIFVRATLLCQSLPPPPANVNVTLPDPQPNQTRRQLMSNHAQNPSCAVCHNLMDPIGFGFEGFDATGASRITEAGQPVDVSGSISGSDVAGPFDGPVELGIKLASSQQVIACAARQWFRYSFGRDAVDADSCALATLIESLRAGGTLSLVESITRTPPFLYRKIPEGGL